MIAPSDMEHCREAIRTGSLSFHAASRLLPARVRDPALALYAFCRLADDAVDDSHDKAPAVLALRDRLDLVERLATEAGAWCCNGTDRAIAPIQTTAFQYARADMMPYFKSFAGEWIVPSAAQRGMGSYTVNVPKRVRIDSDDDAQRRIWFSASGMDAGKDPYYGFGRLDAAAAVAAAESVGITLRRQR